MTKKEYFKQMKKDIEEMRYEFNGLAIDTCLYVCDRIIEGDLEEYWEYLQDEISDSCIYYSNCWKYLEETNQTDFKEAIENGYTSLTSIACYYLEQEVYEILSNFTPFDDLVFDDEEEE